MLGCCTSQGISSHGIDLILWGYSGFSTSMLGKFNTLRPRQNGHHVPDYIFKCISLNENVQISIKILLNFALKSSISNIPALVQIMAWRRPGDKPLSELMMFSLLIHICVTWPQWVNSPWSSTISPLQMATEIKQTLLVVILDSTIFTSQKWPQSTKDNFPQHIHMIKGYPSHFDACKYLSMRYGKKLEKDWDSIQYHMNPNIVINNSIYFQYIHICMILVVK